MVVVREPMLVVSVLSKQLNLLIADLKFALGSNILTLSYETSPACNVLVSENPEITAAKSTVQGTNKATSNRAKTSTPSTSTLSSSASSTSASSASSSSASAASSSASLSTNNNQSSGSSAAATSPGGNKNNFHKRYRRSLPDAKSIAGAPVNSRAKKERRALCAADDDTNCENSKNLDASITASDNVAHRFTKTSSDRTLIDAYQLTDRNDDNQSPNTHATKDIYLDDDFEFNEKPSAQTFNSEHFDIVADMFDDGSGHHASQNHVTSTSKNTHNNNNFDGKIIDDDKIPIEGDDAILNDAPSIIFYDSPTDDASRQDDDRSNDKFSDSSSDAVAAVPSIVKLSDENDNTIRQNSARDKYKYNVIESDATNDNDGNEIPENVANDGERGESSNDIFVETAPSNQQPEFHMLDDTNRVTNTSIEKQTQRILVNVSIATDSGVGTETHGVYMLHVSVPVGPEFMSNIDFPNVSHMHHPHTVNVTPSFEQNDDSSGADSSPPSASSAPPCPPCDCNAALRNPRNATERESTAQNDGTSAAATIAPPPLPSSSPSPPLSIEENRFCLNEQDIPPILILEGEPYR